MEHQFQHRDLQPWPEQAQAGTNEAEAMILEQIAVVVGVGCYAYDRQELKNARHDARSVGMLLQHEYAFGLQPAGDVLLDQAAYQEAIRQHVRQSLGKATGSSQWVFYFAGHGHVEHHQAYLLPYDARKGDRSTYLEVRWLLDQCRESACGEILIMLDSCYGGQALVRPADLSDFILPGTASDRICQIITSGNPDQPVLDGGGSGHSIFTQLLLETLSGSIGIYEHDGTLHFTALLNYLKQEVPRRIDQLGSRQLRQQPIGGNIFGNRDQRDFRFRPCVPRLAPDIIRDSRSADPARRRESLARLVAAVTEQPALRASAVQLALYALQRAAHEPSPLLITYPCSGETDAQVRAQASRTLGLLKEPMAFHPLLAALDDVPEVGRAALDALVTLADPRAVPAILHRLNNANDALWLDMLGAIGAIGDPASIIEGLYQSIRRGKLIPVIGPDFPTALTGLPDRPALIRRLSDEQGLAEHDSLAVVAARTMTGSSRHQFTAFLIRALDDHSSDPGPVYKALARLNCHLWISVAYDHLLASSLRAYRVVTGSHIDYLPSQRPVVLQLMGDIAYPRSLVVLESDYHQLRPDEHDQRSLIEYMRRLVRNKVILFFGCNPNSQDFGLLLRHVLNPCLSDIHVQSFILWNGDHPPLELGGRPIFGLQQPALDVITSLAL